MRKTQSVSSGLRLSVFNEKDEGLEIGNSNPGLTPISIGGIACTAGIKLVPFGNGGHFVYPLVNQHFYLRPERGGFGPAHETRLHCAGGAADFGRRLDIPRSSKHRE